MLYALQKLVIKLSQEMGRRHFKKWDSADQIRGLASWWPGVQYNVPAIYTAVWALFRCVTFDADVAGLEISSEVACTRERIVRQTVDNRRDANIAGPSPRTPGVELRLDVQLTAEVAVVDSQAAAEPHPTVVSRRHQHDLIIGLTTSTERLALAIIQYLATSCWNNYNNRH